MTKVALTDESIYLGLASSFRSLACYHHGGVQGCTYSAGEAVGGGGEKEGPVWASETIKPVPSDTFF